MEALLALDKRGLFPAPGEDAPAFAARLEDLNVRLQEMENQLKQTGSYTVEDVTVGRDARIPASIFSEAAAKTGKLYGFQCDWVPGFFINPSFSGLFGGCAFSFYPDFFSLFIIRSSFRKKKNWLWYRREELLAHELCHVARAGLLSNDFEELFAYQTAATAFRRITGGIFRAQKDVFLFLGVTLLQLLAQIVRVFYCPSLPSWPFWSLLAAVFVFLVLRLARDTAHFRKARRRLAEIYGGADNAGIVIFHAADREIREIARTGNLPELLKKYESEELRWKMMRRRFQ